MASLPRTRRTPRILLSSAPPAPAPARRRAAMAVVMVTALALSACATSGDADAEPPAAPAGAAEETPTPTPEPEPAELPGGGTTMFPDRRIVALYGSPGVTSLGALGQQDVDEAIERITAKAAEYQEFSDVPVQPGFEIIATVASQEPGRDGDYTFARPKDVLEPWIEAAGEAGVHVVLDLQPGRAHFLDQAKQFEEFLRLPHVGLALDPEWRLGPDQRHLRQIGTVDAEEINEVADWLAELTREHELPQKMLILHQFTDGMITDRAEIDTTHEELAVVLHADGHGGPQLKFGTYERLQRDLPEGIWMAWKNFHKQDNPTFTPQQTFEDVDPKPWFVSYQ